MPQQLYNAGRVVGLSAYEIYVKQHDAVDPDSDPADEREWLASMLGMGSSLLLKVPKTTNKGPTEDWMYEVELPDKTNLCAASTIIASFFQGEGRYIKSTVWADGIASYGKLILNEKNRRPTPMGNIPNNVSAWSEDDKNKLTQYMKIVDGIIVHTGDWPDSQVTPPASDFIPDLKSKPRVRLQIHGNIDTPFEILLSGFLIKSVVIGESKVEGNVTNSPKPEDGDFLGPACFPWSNKIVFSVPSSYIHYFVNTGYTRKINGIPGTSNAFIDVKDTPIIDMETTNPEDYYKNKVIVDGKYVDPSSKLFGAVGLIQLNKYWVREYTARGLGDAVLTVYQKSEVYPPALYGSFVLNTGENTLAPLDCVAPGHVKMFRIEDDAEAKKTLIDYITTFPGSNPMNRKADGTIQQLVINQFGEYTLGSLVKGGLQPITDSNGSPISNAKAFVSQFGGNITGLSLSMAPELPDGEGQMPFQYQISRDTSNIKYGPDKHTDSTGAKVGGTAYEAGGQAKLSSSDVSDTMSNINWAMLLTALANNQSIDLLGDTLKQLRAGLDKNYIVFHNGLRLYISRKEPKDTDVPEGSIGIGWGIKTK